MKRTHQSELLRQRIKHLIEQGGLQDPKPKLPWIPIGVALSAGLVIGMGVAQLV